MPRLPQLPRMPRNAQQDEPDAPPTLEELAERVRRLEGGGEFAAGGAGGGDGGSVTINDVTINEDGTIDTGTDQPFLLADNGSAIYSINSDMPTAVGAVAAGTNCTASAEDAWAEGQQTTASGAQSHAEGWATTAAGEFSHAEATGQAMADFSHAEAAGGAYADYAHAEGIAQANGLASHAEGQSQANGANSHAEGETSIANGDSSHVEGLVTLADGEAAHAEGSGTWAAADWSHAEGNEAKASLRAEHAHSSLGHGQYSRFVIGRETTDNVQRRLGINADLTNSASAGDALTVPTNETWMVTVEVAAVDVNNPGVVAGFRIARLVTWLFGGLTAIGVPATDRWDTPSSNTWTATIAVGAGPDVHIDVAGENGRTIRWVATVHATRVQT